MLKVEPNLWAVHDDGVIIGYVQLVHCPDQYQLPKNDQYSISSADRKHLAHGFRSILLAEAALWEIAKAAPPEPKCAQCGGSMSPDSTGRFCSDFCEREAPPAVDAEAGHVQHDFVLVLSGASELSQHLQDTLFYHGCDDATLSARSGRVFLSFTRKAPTLADAVESAIRDVKKAGIGAVVAPPEE